MWVSQKLPIKNSSGRRKENILKEAPRLNRKSHRLPFAGELINHTLVISCLGSG